MASAFLNGQIHFAVKSQRGPQLAHGHAVAEKGQPDVPDVDCHDVDSHNDLEKVQVVDLRDG